MEGNGHTETTLDLKDANGARLKYNEDKGQALLGQFIQESNQNNLEERKHVYILSDPDRTPAQGVPDNDLAEEGFNKALRRIRKDSIWSGFDPRLISRTSRRGQGQVVHCWPRKLWQRLYSQRLDRQLLETYSQTRERLPQVVWILHLHNSKHIGIGVGGGG